MTGTLLVDGVDIYAVYGVFIANEGYNGLLAYNPLKEPTRNDWAEMDGVQVDLSSPKLDTKDFTIHFCAADYGANIGAFIAFIATGVYHSFEFPFLGITKSLRLVSSSKHTGLMRDIRTFSLEFADDYPLDISVTSYVAPIANSCKPQGFKIDGKELSDYGVSLLEGVTSEIMKTPAVKKNITVNVKNKTGAIYGGTETKFQDKEVKLKCALIIDTMAKFRRNYTALLYDLIRPNERAFTATIFQGSYPLYYKSATVEKFYIGGNYVWCEFTLNMCCTSSRPEFEFIMIFDNTFDNTFNRII